MANIFSSMRGYLIMVLAVTGIFSIAFVSISFLSKSEDKIDVKKEMKLVWEDTFDAGEIDQSKWSIVTGDGCPDFCGFGNNELQYYSDNSENIRIEDGALIIQAQSQKMGTRKYTSAKLITKNKADWQYGKIEVRAMLPFGTGTWPAIWMLPSTNSKDASWPKGGEIDIMEHVGYNPGTVYGTIHTGKYNHIIGTHDLDSIVLENIHDEYHTYSIEWTDENIAWFADDVEYHRLSKGKDDVSGWPFNQYPFHLILNLAVGGNWGGKLGVDDDIWPQKFKIDYVRYYQFKN